MYIKHSLTSFLPIFVTKRGKTIHRIVFPLLSHSLLRRSLGSNRPHYQNKRAVAFATAFVLVAGVGFEPHDLRVMSPTSYQAALPRDIEFKKRWCRKPGLNRYGYFYPRDFKSRASANSAIPAHKSVSRVPIYNNTGTQVCQG